jgi:hypothetical protein
MDTDDELAVSVRIPHGEDLDDLDSDVWWVSVPSPLVSCAIDTLQAVLAQWKYDEGNEPEDDKWGPILAAVGYALGGLLHAYTTRDGEQGGSSARRADRIVLRGVEDAVAPGSPARPE